MGVGTRENHRCPAPSLTADLTPYIKLNANSAIPGCPAGGSYTVGTVGACRKSLAASATRLIRRTSCHN